MSQQTKTTKPSKHMCILRIKKLKTTAQIIKSANHNLRYAETPNTNKSQQINNLHLFSGKLFKNADAPKTENVISYFQDRLSTIKVRKNAVLCVEFMIGSSPRSLLNNKEYDEYLSASNKWLQKKFGKENVFLASVHHDETTPHLAAYVLPIVIKGGKETLNARHYFGGKDALSNLQTEFHESVGVKFGLNRGVKKSKLDNITAEKFNEAIAKPIPNLPSKLELMNPLNAIDFQKRWETLHYQLVDAQLHIDNYEQERQKHATRNNALIASVTESQKNATYAVERKDELETMSYKAIGQLIKKTFAPNELESIFNVKLKGKEDIFDALKKAKKAPTFEMAVKFVLDLLPDKFKSKWNDLDYPPEPKIEFIPSESGKTKVLPVMRPRT
jgi:Plasmid recombination enzyme